MPESIFHRIAGGDPAAVRECISRHGGLVWSIARRFLASPGDLEDAVQEVFIELWTSAARYDPSVASESTFVAMIARRTLIDGRRKSSRRVAPVSLPDGLAGTSIGPPEIAERSDEAGRAALALEALDDPQKSVLTLSIYRAMTYDQIARATGLPLGTVKTHARRGLIRLRQLLGVPNRRAVPAEAGGDS